MEPPNQTSDRGYFFDQPDQVKLFELSEFGGALNIDSVYRNL